MSHPTKVSLSSASSSASASASHRAFLVVVKPVPPKNSLLQKHPSSTSTTALSGGIGIATNYTWREEQYEIELKVSVPPETTGRDILFKAKPTSIQLELVVNNDNYNVNEQKHEQITTTKTLLDGNRKMRGKIDIDGTFWSISDKEEVHHDPNRDASSPTREITVTIEKMMVPPKDQFEVMDFDWGGIYPDDDDEIISKTYDEPEELDIREYAASLGVDIDNINMTMVDKSMFSSGMNMTHNTLEELTKKGYVQEVTKQADGSEYITNEDGEAVPFQPMGTSIDDQELKMTGLLNDNDTNNKPNHNTHPFPGRTNNDSQRGKKSNTKPLIDTISALQQNTVPAEEARDANGMPIGGANDAIINMEEDSIPNDDSRNPNETSNSSKNALVTDPIDMLTVAKLKDILKNNNLKVSGNKQELRERLRDHVKSLMNSNTSNDFQ